MLHAIEQARRGSVHYVLILLLMALPLLVSATELNDATQSLLLAPLMQVLEDASGKATIADVSSPPMAGRFEPYHAEVFSAGFTHSAFWLKIDLADHSSGQARLHGWLLELAYPSLDSVDLYLPDAAGGHYLAERSGDTLPYSTRQIKQNNFLFAVDLPPGQSKTLYLRLRTEGLMQAPLTLWSEKTYLEEKSTRLYVVGLIYGVLLGMLFYNLFIYLNTRDSNYLYYVICVALFVLYQFSINGVATRFFWPEHPGWASVATPFFMGGSGLFSCQFARTFLRTDRYSRFLDRALILSMVLNVLVMVLALIAGYGLALRLANCLVVVFTAIIFVAGILSWYRGQRAARYFILAWSAFLLGGLMNVLMMTGYLSRVFFTLYANQLGAAIEVALLSLALADRINALREQQAERLLESGRQLEASNQLLAQSSRLKDEFLAILTHELRTPMNGVIGSLELMQTMKLEPELEHYQQTAASSARDMMRMVNEMLTLTELQAGRLKLQLKPFNLYSMLEALRGQFAGHARAKGLGFSIEIADTLPHTLYGDDEKISQCLDCLLDNAIKFTREGAVALRVTSLSPGTGRLCLTFAVIDSGIGFTDLQEATLYERFLQADSSMTREYGGLGVGLAICRQLVELLGGRLTHQSQPGRGSCFQIALEVHAPEDVASTSILPPGLWPASQKIVLLLDSNSLSQLRARGMLLKLGYRVLTTATGSEALECLRREKVHLVVFDCQEPYLNHAATFQQLRNVYGHEQLPIIAIGSPDIEWTHGLAANVTGFLGRPLRYEALKQVLERHLGGGE